MGLFWDSEDEKFRREELKSEARSLKFEYEMESKTCANLAKYRITDYFTSNGLMTFSGSFHKHADSQRIHELSYHGNSYDSSDYDDYVSKSLSSEWHTIRSNEDPDVNSLGYSKCMDIIGWVASSLPYEAKKCSSLAFRGCLTIKPGEAFMAAFDGAFKLHKIGNSISSNEEQLKAALEQLQNYRG